MIQSHEAPFIMQNLKKSFQWIQGYNNVPFPDQNSPFVPNENFFHKNH